MRRKIIITLAACLVIVLGLLIYVRFDKAKARHFQVTFLNVGQGDAALIRFADGRKMLVDCGIDRSILHRLGQTLPFYDRTLDYLLVTHPDADHYGGCADVLKRYEVKEIISNGEEKTNDPYWPTWMKYVQAENGINKRITEEEKWNIAGTELEFLAPDPALSLEKKYKEGNNSSIVFRLTNGGESVLFMGDAEVPLEKALMEKYCGLNTVTTGTAPAPMSVGVTPPPQGGVMTGASTSSMVFQLPCRRLKADYVKIGHHGSDSSSDESFLEAVAPTKAVISVGKNSFGHPSFRVLKKLQRAGAEILRTDEIGDIIAQ